MGRGIVDTGIVILGFGVGILIGLTGVGGASLLTPVLVLLGIHPSVAVGTDLFCNAITKGFGVIQHFRQKTIRLQAVLYLAAGSIPGAVLAIGLLVRFDAFFHNQETIIKHALGFMLVIVAVITIWRQFFTAKADNRSEDLQPSGRKKLATAGIGFILGMLVGLTSIGSGSLFAIALIYLYRMKASETVGTDIAHALLLVTVAGALHAGLGNIDYALAFNLLAGSVPGVLIGSSLSARVPSKALRTVMAALILISGIKLI